MSEITRSCISDILLWTTNHEMLFKLLLNKQSMLAFVKSLFAKTQTQDAKTEGTLMSTSTIYFYLLR